MSEKRKAKAPSYLVDGVIRSVTAEHKINQTLRETFKTAAGKRALDYLKEMTLYTVHPPGNQSAFFLRQPLSRVSSLAWT